MEPPSNEVELHSAPEVMSSEPLKDVQELNLAVSEETEAIEVVELPLAVPEEQEMKDVVEVETSIQPANNSNENYSESILIDSFHQPPNERIEPLASPEVDYVELLAPIPAAPQAQLLLFKGHPAEDQLQCAVKLAKMLFTLDLSLKRSELTVEDCFRLWLDHARCGALLEAKKLEQRVQKLKALLARTYQAKKLNQEDNALTQQKTKEILSSKVKDDKERSELLRAMQEQAAESERQRAFHYDMEILIQRAASEITSQPATPQVPRYSKSQHEDIEAELRELRGEVQQHLLAEESLKTQIDDMNMQLADASRKQASLELRLLEETKIASKLRAELREEMNLRADAERELKMVISSQGDLSAEIERKMKLRYDTRKLEVNEELEFTKTQLEKALFDLRTVEVRHAEVDRELHEANSRLREVDLLAKDNLALRSLLEQVKKTSFHQLVSAEERHEKNVDLATDLVQVGLEAAKTRVALEMQLAEMAAHQKQVLRLL